MGLVSVAEPRSDAELSAMLSLLSANNIPAFAQDGSFGGVLPGFRVQVDGVRRVMVPNDCAQRARDILAALDNEPKTTYTIS